MKCFRVDPESGALEAFDEIDVGNKPFWVMATTLD